MPAEPRTPLVGDVVRLMEQWAPTWTAESWDRVGLLAGNPDAKAARVMVCLELTQRILDHALKAKADLILCHHPPLFKPLTDLRTDRPATARLIEAAARGVALYAAHTNLDAAPDGVNHVLARALGIEDIEPLVPIDHGLSKLVAFVPSSHAEKVSQALFAAGAGVIGDYRECSFMIPGTGTFLAPLEGNPFVGRPGNKERVEELRLETVVPQGARGAVLNALKQAHPYEEPAYDLYPLAQGPGGYGLGQVGRVTGNISGAEFAIKAAKALNSLAPRMAGAMPRKLRRVAVLGGSGGDFVAQAARAGAQMLVTGEASHHAGQQAEDVGICLLVLGHFETENPVVKPWADRLAQLLAAHGFTCQVKPGAGVRNPWRAVTV